MSVCTEIKKSGPHCSCMNLFFHQQVNSYPLYSFLIERYKGRTLWTCSGWIGIVSCTFIILFLERLLSIPIRKWYCVSKCSLRQVCPTFSLFAVILLRKSYQTVRYSFFKVKFKVKEGKLLNWNFCNFESFLKRFCPRFFFFKIVFVFWYCLKAPNLTFLNQVILKYNMSSNF